MFKYIYIEITNDCNLNCSFCKGTTRNKMFMSVNSFKAVLDKIVGYTEHINLHVLGEPLIHPEIHDILKLAHNYDMKVNLTTNGRLIKDKIDIINNSECIRQINISLHSYKNNADIELLLDEIDKINNDCYISFRLWNLGSNYNNDKIIECLNKHYETSIDIAKKSFKISNKIYINFDNEFKWPDIDGKIYSQNGKCYGLRTHIGILVDGTIVPCCLDANGMINLGNILKQDLNSILNSEKCKMIRQGFLDNKLVEPLCKRCQYVTKFDKNKNNVK